MHNMHMIWVGLMNQVEFLIFVTMDDNYCDSNEPDYFETWQEARDYAKANPDTKIARCDDGRGWEIKK